VGRQWGVGGWWGGGVGLVLGMGKCARYGGLWGVDVLSVQPTTTRNQDIASSGRQGGAGLWLVLWFGSR